MIALFFFDLYIVFEVCQKILAKFVSKLGLKIYYIWSFFKNCLFIHNHIPDIFTYLFIVVMHLDLFNETIPVVVVASSHWLVIMYAYSLPLFTPHVQTHRKRSCEFVEMFFHARKKTKIWTSEMKIYFDLFSVCIILTHRILSNWLQYCDISESKCITFIYSTYIFVHHY